MAERPETTTEDKISSLFFLPDQAAAQKPSSRTERNNGGVIGTGDSATQHSDGFSIPSSTRKRFSIPSSAGKRLLQPKLSAHSLTNFVEYAPSLQVRPLAAAGWPATGRPGFVGVHTEELGAAGG
ncbi:hypothetical protein KSP39_PZI022302 [Platanthera zijinensis]|uniref:Uncharacterized protein n=1 Tax=Platanthera zijinensis TaxID=2320716 RepID=A0AAP0FUC8_9ASPA